MNCFAISLMSPILSLVAPVADVEEVISELGKKPAARRQVEAARCHIELSNITPRP